MKTFRIRKSPHEETNVGDRRPLTGLSARSLCLTGRFKAIGGPCARGHASTPWRVDCFEGECSFFRVISMKMLTRVTLALAFACAPLSGALLAQTITSATPAVPSSTPSAALSPGDHPWSFGAGLNGSYEGNALFTGPEGDEEFANQVFASLARGWALRRGRVS